VSQANLLHDSIVPEKCSRHGDCDPSRGAVGSRQAQRPVEEGQSSRSIR
jgi:hypothetical protein